MNSGTSSHTYILILGPKIIHSTFAKPVHKMQTLLQHTDPFSKMSQVLQGKSFLENDLFLLFPLKMSRPARKPEEQNHTGLLNPSSSFPKCLCMSSKINHDKNRWN